MSVNYNAGLSNKDFSFNMSELSSDCRLPHQTRAVMSVRFLLKIIYNYFIINNN